MTFLQVIEIHTDDLEALEAHHERYLAATEGERTIVQEWMCRDLDRPGTYVVIVEFPSAEAAAANDALPATAEIAEAMAGLSTAPPTFRNLELIRHD